MKISDSCRKSQKSDISTAYPIKISNMGNNCSLRKEPASPAVEPQADTDVAGKGNPGPAHRPTEETLFEQRWIPIGDSRQYALTAKGNGWYPCLHSRRTNFYLKTNEVWKYGVARGGDFGRFKATFLIRNKVSCVIQYKGAFTHCQRQVQIRLFNYPNLPENTARPPAQRLPRPPYNPDVPFTDIF